MSVVAFRKARLKRREEGMARAVRNVYALQRRIGFGWLNFLPELEREYQDAQLPTTRARTRKLYALALCALLGLIPLNHLAPIRAFSTNGEGMILLTAAMVLFPFSLAFLPRFERHFRIATVATFHLCGLGIIGIMLRSGLDGRHVVEDGLVLMTLSAYFVSAMRMAEAVVFGAMLIVVYVAGSYLLGIAQPDLAYQVYFLLLANLLGALGHYYFDYTARLNFLLRNELEGLAYCDGLTGLLNRRALHNHLRTVWKQAERQGCTLGLLVVDMDELKGINDSRGHSEGDRCLKLIGDVITSLAQRPLDVAGRTGGDEFVGVWYDVDVEWFRTLAESLNERIRIEAHLQGVPSFSVSVGISCERPVAGSNPFRSLNEADEAMYRIKRGRGAARA
jgi:diguanylate cyclase (GGDEF)-like protein